MSIGAEVTPQSGYVLGSEDQLVIRILEAQEIADKPVPVDQSGFIELPLAGKVRAAGLTTGQLQDELTRRLTTYIRSPHVIVSVQEYRSQPVSVIGAVGAPGLHQLRGQKTLVEVLSLAGGPRQDAGHSIKITRRLAFGRLPLPGARDDASGAFSVAEVSLRSILDAARPEDNIQVRPYDVISVPRADLVYVVGEVEKSGGFVLNERESITVFQSLSLAGGLRRTAAPQSARILRAGGGTAARREIPVDLKKILAGRASDISLQPDDILFIPASGPKRAGARALEAAIQVGTGVVIWRR